MACDCDRHQDAFVFGAVKPGCVVFGIATRSLRELSRAFETDTMFLPYIHAVSNTKKEKQCQGRSFTTGHLARRAL